MRALEGLPSATKNLIIPIIRLHPWLTARQLMRAIERIKEAIGERFFGLDLDETRRNRRATPAYEEFERLFDPADGWRNYYEFVASVPFAVPVLRAGADMQLGLQLAQVETIDRGLFVRVDVQQPFSVRAVAQECVERQLENVVFVLDCGWRDHLLPYEAACVGLIRTISEVSPDFEFVVGGGDFPADGFDTKGANFQIPGEERQLVDGVRRVLNDVEIIFGDWASTRPPPTDSLIRRSRPRLDMPTSGGWECWRSETPAGTYGDLAANAARDRRLGAMSDLWGEQLIIATRDGGEPAIKSPATAAAVRINLHIVTQAHFDTGRPQVSDELVVGEL